MVLIANVQGTRDRRNAGSIASTANACVDSIAAASATNSPKRML
jgi:hypothetical protein